MSIPFTADAALFWVAVGLCISSAVVSTEWLVLLRRGELGAGGIFDWRVLRLRRSVLRVRALRPLDRTFLSHRWTTAFLLAGLVAPVCVVAGWGRWGAPVAAGVLVTHQVALALRFPLGRDGADQLALILSIVVFGYSLHPDGLAAKVAALFLCAHLIIGYEISGFAKVAGSDWRQGRALPGILRTRCYGWPWLSDALPRWASTAGGWCVMAFEIGFVAILLPWPIVGLLVLGVGALFHLACWITMGLNAFFLTYMAAYPVLVWLVLSH